MSDELVILLFLLFLFFLIMMTMMIMNLDSVFLYEHGYIANLFSFLILLFIQIQVGRRILKSQSMDQVLDESSCTMA